MDVSVVIPLYNEEESLRELVSWNNKVLTDNQLSFEIILIDDGSNDRSWQVIEELSAKDESLRAIRFRKNYGKSAAVFCGFKIAQGEVVITMDADLQDNPDEIPALYKMIKEDGFDMVSGWKKIRHDPFSKTFPSKFFNYSARKITGIKLHDFNCGLKAYKNVVIKSIEVYGEMHRYIPVMVKQAGFSKIGEKEVTHFKRKYGRTKFGLERFVNGYLDLISITFISRFGKRPMHFFGTLGTLMFLMGFFASVWLGTLKLYCVHNHIPFGRLTESPYFFLAITTMILGTQLFLAGFLAELIQRNSGDRNEYQIEKIIR